ncbi:hypothetical protein ACLQ9F_09190 [Bordetella avium]|uniref:hypothetical protein n=1 Tax=Bordetella avium TaxID=521 RepID=UPI000E6A3D48|nr:hypothetical protein [Bordetella avium]AZY51939.1 hypothetical protein C0J07_05045 [Bordetella avium]RIQ17060.1 hypothetical protein D0850_12320 [Bordetella avium]RIQ36214.1 hypothetical protein D0849_00600 [Bordetella avium]RIQ73228.1 hypothetical protein D0839_02545 [Bordetella avium]
MSYWHDFRRDFPAFVRNRFVPFVGASAIFALAAHKDTQVLAASAYLIATLAPPATIAALSLAAAGNLIAGRDSQRVCRAVLGLALGLAFLTLLVTAALTVVWAARFERLGAWQAAWLYLLAAALLVVNTALLSLHEASGAAVQCAWTLRLALWLGQLRAIGDTLLPQAIYGLTLLLGWGLLLHGLAESGQTAVAVYLLGHSALLLLVAAGLSWRWHRLQGLAQTRLKPGAPTR